VGKLDVWSRPLVKHSYRVIRRMCCRTGSSWERHDDRGGPSHRPRSRQLFQACRLCVISIGICSNMPNAQASKSVPDRRRWGRRRCIYPPAGGVRLSGHRRRLEVSGARAPLDRWLDSCSGGQAARTREELVETAVLARD
jgi:hypothetical protein